MPTRRQVLGGAGATTAVLSLGGCGDATGLSDYDKAVAQERSELPGTPEMVELVRYATLAANSHNTQPWRFRLSEGAVEILPDFSRSTPVVDPDHHHLFASLGCAAENLALAAAARGRVGDIRFEPADDGHVAIDLANSPAAESELFAAITDRQCTRSVYEGRSVPAGDLARLQEAARLDGVQVLLLTGRPEIETVLEHVIAANTAQIEDPAFVRELKSWLRFSEGEALATRDGLFSALSGNPTLPSWLSSLVFSFAFTAKSENARYAEQIRSSSGIAIFISEKNDKAHWVNAGRAYQRFALQATALGIRQAFINQPVEVPTFRSEFANWLELGEERPDFVVRFGYAQPMGKSLRRPVEAVVS